MKQVIQNGILVREDGLEERRLLLEDGRIAGFPDWAEQIDGEVIDAEGNYVCPGFVDLHVHGGGGFEVNGATAEEVVTLCAAHAAHGTTSILPTAFTAPVPDLLAAISAVRQAKALCKDCEILGIHLEGPFLSPAQAGAQKDDALREPDLFTVSELLDAWDGVRMMGAAPELAGGLELGEELARRGIVASVAHSDADFETVEKALRHGYRDVTHLYSCCSTVHRKNAYRTAGVVEAGLYFDALTVQVIADGKHLPPSLLKLIYKAKGAGRMYLVTDGLSHSACPLEEGTVIRREDGSQLLYEDGVFKLPNRQAFAGSACTMDQMLRNMVALAGVSLSDAVKMASTTPAQVIGAAHKGRIAPGKDADLVFLDRHLQVRRVMTGGTIFVRIWIAFLKNGKIILTVSEKLSFKYADVSDARKRIERGTVWSFCFVWKTLTAETLGKTGTIVVRVASNEREVTGLCRPNGNVFLPINQETPLYRCAVSLRVHKSNRERRRLV